MSRLRNEVHAQLVEAWKKKHSGLSAMQFNSLYINAIQAVLHKSHGPLSSITVSAVVDRTLFECKEKYPVLLPIANVSGQLQLNDFLDKLEACQPDDVQKALQEFLIDLLDVFGKITAEILTKYLHQELLAVTNTAPPKRTDFLSAAPLGLAKRIESRNERHSEARARLERCPQSR